MNRRQLLALAATVPALAVQVKASPAKFRGMSDRELMDMIQRYLEEALGDMVQSVEVTGFHDGVVDANVLLRPVMGSIVIDYEVT